MNQKSGDDAVSDSSAGSASRSRTFDGTVSGFHTWRAAPAASRKFSSSCVRCADRIWSLNARCALVPSGAVPSCRKTGSRFRFEVKGLGFRE